MGKIEITQKQKEQFNRMLAVLRVIARDYQSPEKIRKNSEKDYGLDPEEALNMPTKIFNQRLKK